MTAVIDWGDHPDWPDRLAAARKPASPEQRRWDAHYAHQQTIARRSESNPNGAAKTAMARTEAEHGKRPGTEEKS